jgi:phosphonate transport system permease protein
MLALCLSARSARWRLARRVLAACSFGLMFCLSWGDARISLADILHGNSSALPFLRGLFPPALGVLPNVLAETVTTLELAFLGTVLALPIAVPLGLLGAGNVLPIGALRAFFRAIMGISRSIDPMILALVMVSAVGLGAVPGIVALAFHSVGALGKLFYEACEAAEAGPADALRSIGASRAQVVRWALWPQVAPHLVSIVLFRFELNVRLSTVLGLVGAGGIGFLLTTYLRGAQYEKVTVVVGAIVLLIMILDALSSRLRHDLA